MKWEGESGLNFTAIDLPRLMQLKDLFGQAGELAQPVSLLNDDRHENGRIFKVSFRNLWSTLARL